MGTSKLKIALAALMLLAAVGVGAGGLLQPTQAVQPPPPGNPKLEKVPPGVPAVEGRKPVSIREDAQVAQLAWSGDDKVVATISRSFEIAEVTDSDGENPMNVLADRSAVKQKR